MKPNELDTLIDDCLEGRLSESDAAKLSTHLEQSAEARARYWDAASIHGLLESSLQTASLRVITGQASAITPKTTRWMQWRPLTAAAAGLIIGLFSASMVFAYAVPRVVATASRLTALMDGSFENAAEPLPSGLPEEFGVWSGKEPNQVRVDVVDGERVLRFLECKRGPSAVLQLIDLRTLRADPNEGEAKLVLSARIRDDRAEVGDPFRFSMHLSLFSGSPDSLRKTWPTAKKEAISSGSAVLESRGGTPKSWRELSAKTLVPPGADFALVQIGVLDPGAFPKHSATFGEQFVDDVQLTLQIQPELPVRVAQR